MRMNGFARSWINTSRNVRYWVAKLKKSKSLFHDKGYPKGETCSGFL